MRFLKLIRVTIGEVGRKFDESSSKINQSDKVSVLTKFIWRNTKTISGRSALFFTIFISIVLLRVVSTQAVGSGIYYVKNTNTNIGSFPSAIPNNSFRVDTSTTNTVSVTSIAADFVGSSSATLSPTTGWTQTVSNSADDANHKITFGFNSSFNGTSYDGVFISSNTYFTFGTGSSNYSGLNASNPAFPGVFLCSQDNSYQRVYYKLDSAGVMRVRYEGNNSTSGTAGSPTIVYEAVFYSGQSYIDIHMGANSACPAASAPTVSSVSSNKTNGSYKAGEVIDIDVTFSEAVTSTGNVTVTLETGATDRTCTFTISNSTFGTCNYTVQAGDTSADLTVNSVSGTIKDVAYNNLSSPIPVTNLNANKNLVIDTTSPVISALSLITSNSNKTPIFTFSSSEAASISYSGSCASSASSANAGDNSITFNALQYGTYSDCIVTLVDLAGNSSSALSVPTFTLTTAISTEVYVPKTTNATPLAIANLLDPSNLTSGNKIVLNVFPEFTNQEGKKLDLSVNQVVYFQLDNDEHSATITQITDDYVTFVLASKPKNGKLKIGETGRYDVNEDGIMDVEISVIGVAGKYAGMTFKQLAQVPKTSVTLAKGFNWVPYIVGFVLVTGALVVARRRKTGASHKD